MVSFGQIDGKRVWLRCIQEDRSAKGSMATKGAEQRISYTFIIGEKRPNFIALMSSKVCMMLRERPQFSFIRTESIIFLEDMSRNADRVFYFDWRSIAKIEVRTCSRFRRTKNDALQAIGSPSEPWGNASAGRS